MNAYQKLKKQFSDISLVEDISSILSWDQATIMPKSSAQQRGAQMGLLNRIQHQMLTHPDIKYWMEEALNDDTLSSEDKVNIFEMKRHWIHTTSVPEQLSEKLTMATTVGQIKWEEALHNNSFDDFSPYLENILEVSIEAAHYKGEKLECSSYDACLDSFEAGITVREVDKIFNDLELFIPDFLQKVIKKQENNPLPPKNLSFDIEKQKKLGTQIIKAIGFDFSKGRVDTSTHPFCGGTPYDIRITSRFDSKNFISGLMAMVHEAGHALYDFGLPEKWQGQPAGQARGMSIHESQSLLIEMQMARSEAFLKFLHPQLLSTFGLSEAEWSFNHLKNLYYQVTPGFIRVDADEVTYPLHVILRYNIEKKLFDRTLKVRDIPHFWNEYMAKTLNIEPSNDKEGALQDIHWSCGAFGYFPCYTLGALTAAQLYEAFKQEHRNAEQNISCGEFSSLVGWLRKNVHQKASLLSRDELLTKATGQPLCASFFKKHLQTRYLT